MLCFVSAVLCLVCLSVGICVSGSVVHVGFSVLFLCACVKLFFAQFCGVVDGVY